MRYILLAGCVVFLFVVFFVKDKELIFLIYNIDTSNRDVSCYNAPDAINGIERFDPEKGKTRIFHSCFNYFFLYFIHENL